MNDKPPSDKVFCVVVRDALNNKPPVCVAKTRKEDQARLWAGNLRGVLLDAQAHTKQFVYVWKETELYYTLRRDDK